ncbi:MAG: hypothetical protein B6D72_12355 [gamma proteobacterium symbiont of Ctena orbiculata]|nr:MAG: hypothetical protein B6D82_14490 [gamma proteobacterium symbiont of Ctena orbiculata]PVV10531.1 MAG: hypothetical protein B6D72_12355 [gamma proteobacterium symbiont of Ctena orbiculata]PVV21090.1 MAG: hypothetical protein B6D74_12185 [gamma proteobacterium symbiont of Ctena orbiculata]
MSFTKDNNPNTNDQLIIRKSDSKGFAILELNPEWEAHKRRLEAFTSSVLARFSPEFLRAKSCITYFGRGWERKNSEAMTYWLVSKFEDALTEESADLGDISEEAFNAATRKLYEDSGLWQIME